MDRKRPFNGSPTADGYYTTFDSSEIHRPEPAGTPEPSGTNSAFIVNVTIMPESDLDDGGVELDQTFGDIKKAFLAGRPVYVYGPDGGSESWYRYFPIILAVDTSGTAGRVYVLGMEDTYFEAETDDVYPHEPRGE